MESRDLVSVSRLVSTPIFCESWSRSFQVSRLWILQRNGLLKFLWFNEFLFVVLAGKKQPKHVGKMPAIWNKLKSEVMTTFSKIISAKCTNFEVSVSNFKSRVLVSEFLMNSRSQRLRSRLHHCGNKHGESVLTSDGLARLGLGLETCPKAGFLESRSRRSQVSSRSRALRLETLHRLFFMKFCKKQFLKTTVSKIIVQNSAIQRGRLPSTPFKIYAEFNKKCACTKDTAARNLCNKSWEYPTLLSTIFELFFKEFCYETHRLIQTRWESAKKFLLWEAK